MLIPSINGHPLDTPMRSMRSGQEDAADVILNPGDFHFYCPIPGRPGPARVLTLLGSCVSFVVWHPGRGIGCMSHGVLPARSRRGEGVALDARFCDEAVILLQNELNRVGILAQQCQAYLVGGGRMYQSSSNAQSIGDCNIEMSRDSLQQAGFVITAQHVGKEGYRKVALDLRSGEIVVTVANNRITLRRA